MPDSANYHTPFTILLVGDSITAFSEKGQYGGFARLLRDNYLRKIQVANLGMSTAQTLSYWNLVNYSTFEDALPKHIDVVLMMLGTNDCSEYYLNDIPVDSYGENVLKLAYRMRAYAPDVVLIKPPVMGVCDEHSDPLYVEQFAAKVYQIGDENGFAVLDIRQKMQEGDNILCDNLHYNTLGNKYHYEIVRDYLDSKYTLDQWYTPGDKWAYCEDPNAEKLADGTCGCKSDSFRDESTGACHLCPNGVKPTADYQGCDCSALGTTFEFNKLSRTCQCAGEMYLSGQGVCVHCPPNAHPNVDKDSCLCKDENAQYDLEKQVCVCVGDRYKFGDICIACPADLPVTELRDGCVCYNQNEIFSVDLNACVCPENTELRGAECVSCAEGYYRGHDMSVCEAVPLAGFSGTTLGWTLPIAFVVSLITAFLAIWGFFKQAPEKPFLKKQETRDEYEKLLH